MNGFKVAQLEHSGEPVQKFISASDALSAANYQVQTINPADFSLSVDMVGSSVSLTVTPQSDKKAPPSQFMIQKWAKITVQEGGEPVHMICHRQSNESVTVLILGEDSQVAAVCKVINEYKPSESDTPEGEG